jgi:DNA-binding MarR family transcriptional regulator
VTRPLSDRDYRALARFRYALRSFQRFSEDAARDAGLTPAQHQLLLAVRGWDGEGPPTVSDLAERLQQKLHSTTELVSRAEANGLVDRAVDPTDHRRTLVGLTEDGASKLAELTLDHRQELRRFRTELTSLLDALD